MAMGIGQQIKGMMDRARHYWAELTDEKGRDQRAREEREDAVHQRYGGVRTQGERDMDALLGDRQESAQDHPGISDADLANPSARATRTGQLGSQAGQQDRQMQAGNQAQRQYAQQGGSGLQKPLGQQIGAGTGPEADTVRSQQSRRPGQQNH